MAIKLPDLKNFSLKKFLLCIIFLASISSYSQTSNKRISIPNPTDGVLNKLHEAGIDLKCGVQFDKNNNMILELVPEELSSLDSKLISYTVLIEDLSKYYKERSEELLPIAKKELEELKRKSKENNSNEASKSLSFNSVTVDNIIQYDGCDEIDWSANVPQNFELGSMAGCLTYAEMLAQLDKMRVEYPNLITVKTDASPGTTTHGNSYNNQGQDTWAGQPIYYVKISDNPDTDESEPEALFTGMTHSREVSSMMNLMYFMWYVLENYDTDSGIKNLVDNRELYFIPVANPDGLMWNEQQNPSGGGLQRKNLNPSANTGDNVTRGVDLNRNYDYFWGSHFIYANGTTGSSGTQSAQTYRGTSAFSEPETQIIRDFAEDRDFKTALNHHASSNLLPHGYNGYPGAPASGREDQYAKFCHDLTRYNRYIYGAAPDILTIANGDMSDWMFGGAIDLNSSQGYLDTVGATEGILALAPENGAWNNSNEGFWPTATKITEIAQRAVRMNYVSGLYAGKFAQLHDFTATDINSLTGNLDFGIEFTGQTLGDFTLTVTPVSANIVSITSPSTETGMTKLEQRQVTAAYTLNASIQTNDLIEYQITLSNEDHIIYQANVIKYYQPTVVFQDNPDVDGITNWITSSWTTTSDGYQGTTGLTNATGSYGNGLNTTITLDRTFNFTTAGEVLVQFNAKWALERNFDYVQLQASVNGGTWNELCGKYTKPGSDIGGNRYNSANSADGGSSKTTADQNNQPTGEQMYEGHGMDKWVMEEIYINVANNTSIYNQNNVEFRFVFDSDSNNRADGYDENFDPFDGFTFDDFKVITLNNNIAQVITFDPLVDKTIVAPDFSVSATASSGLPVSFTILSGPATIAGNTISLLGTVGTVVVQASQAGNSNYNAAANVTQSFEVTEVVVCSGNATITTVDYPYSDDFQAGFADWVQASGDDGDWTRNSGNTQNNTGPDNDADNNNSGFYMYTEASSGGIGSNGTANFESPCFDLNGMTDADFSFAYHMYGSNMGQLFLELSEDNGATWTDVTTSPLSGQQHADDTTPWSTMDVELQSYVGKIIKLRFRGVTGGGQKSDMAIDNISMITVEDVLSANQVEFDDFQIYPNPFDDNLKIRLPLSLNYNKLKVSIVDLQGRTLKEKIVTSNTQEINVDNLIGISNSVYFISIEIDGNVRVIKKLIKI